jgi:glycosyltransferase involved in cell wall biosynthesis
MKNIGINLLYINPKLSGGSEKYALNLLREISLIDNKNKYFIYINKESKSINFELGSNFVIRVLYFDYSSVYLRYFWEQIILPFYILNDRIDLLHSLGYVMPLFTRTKTVTSILDINYKGHSNNMLASKRFLLGFMVKLSAMLSNKIITISEFSKTQIVKYTKVNSDKIVVTLLSGSSDTFPKSNVKTNLILQKYKIDTNYIIAFNGGSLHKNIERLIEASHIILKGNSDMKLVLVGHHGRSNNVDNYIKKHDLTDKVLFTGFVPDEDINHLLSNAKVFVFPSLYEGFGIPLLDAQACKVPVAASNAGSLPEVGGGDVVYFNPYDTIEMKSAISNILNDNKLAEDIVDKGLENRSRFNWNKTAQETLDVYNKLLY